LELFLKLKATISGNGFLSIDYSIFHKIEYITSINLGHGVKYFKSFLYTENASPKQYDKLVLIPSKRIINVALRYGWKEENIIKICLPKWDKYDKIKNKEIEKSIFIFFTWRQLKKEKNISSEYINNIIKLINSDILNKKLIEKNITLYYCLHHKFSQYKNMIKINQLHLNYINNSQISETLMKSSLLITDFSSVTFDYIYKRKPIIIYIPDSEDLNIKDNYDINYINLINNMKNGKIYFENKCNTTEQVINKTIFYIDNNFELESNMRKFYNSFGLKCGNNTHRFIDYVQNMK
jgi:CDP-glycerol glycerophosphotransferase (TagB/SpsB family)